MGSHTARLPSWARSLSAFAAQGDEDMAGRYGVTPEEAYGFHRVGGGVPGRIKGTSRQQDFSALRAFRNRSSPGMLTSDDINNRVDTRAAVGQAQRYGMWENYLRQVTGQPQPQPQYTAGEVRRGGDGKMWKYNEATGKGEPIPGTKAPVDNWTGKPAAPVAAAIQPAVPKGGLPPAPAEVVDRGPPVPQAQPSSYYKPPSTFYTPDGKPITFQQWKDSNTKPPPEVKDDEEPEY